MPFSELARQRPEWMKVRAPSGNTRFAELQGIMREGGLHTVCEEARCPNIGECWGRGTATFQIIGEVCTRACRYCAVTSGRPDAPPEPLEPLRVARAVERMGLRHVVVTSVDRDDLPDRGAGHFAATIRAIRRRNPECGVEVLVPDFLGFREQALRTVLQARPDVFNHNIETAERFYRRVRPKGDYRKALDLLDRAKTVWAELWPDAAPLPTKSGIIVGMGETNEDVAGVMRDLRDHRVDIVTIGQYLQPTERHLPLDRWVTPEDFAGLRSRANGWALDRCLQGRWCLELPGRGAAARRVGPDQRRHPLTVDETGGAHGAEAVIEQGETAARPAGEGWFVINARDSEWVHTESWAPRCCSRASRGSSSLASTSRC